MALLNADQVSLVFKDGVCARTAVYSIKNADAADTLDVGNG